MPFAKPRALNPQLRVQRLLCRLQVQRLPKRKINAEERLNDLRACCIFPGDIDAPPFNKRPVPASPEARARMMQPEDIVACVWFAATLPQRATVEEILVRPSRPWTG